MARIAADFRWLFTVAFLATIAGSARGQSKPNAAATKFFEDRVRPVLANRCFKCHGPEKQKNGLRLDSLEAILKGGVTGPAIKPGKPDESLLIGAIRHGELFQMPPKTKLPAQEIADLTRWVQMGAPWPNAAVMVRAGDKKAGPLFTQEEKSFWAFQPPVDPPIPSVKNSYWAQSPLDRLVLAQLEAKGLQPAPPADKRTLIRRATFDLIGLPPTPAEIDAFLQDQSPNAFAAVVERLLSSPHYGERWGRHWLDVARYADSNGMDENLAYGNAWRFRDYVVAAFNRDKPYAQFLHEQLAGDLLPAGDDRTNQERLVATGFLCLGPKMLAEDDPVKMQMDIIDEQIDTVGRTFLGLTLGCARCHSHKFDPIPIADYYSLAGIFKSTKTMDNFKVVARWQERPLATRAEVERKREHDSKIARKEAEAQRALKDASNAIVEEAKKHVHEYLKAAPVWERREELLRQLHPALAYSRGAVPPGVIVIEAEKYTRGNVLRSFDGYGAGIGVIYNQGQLPNFAEYEVVIPVAGVYQVDLRYAAAEPRPVTLLVNGELLKPDAADHITGSWYPDTQQWRAETLVVLRAGKNTLRLERAEPFPHFDKLALAPHNDIAADQLAVPPTLRPPFLKQWASFLKRTGNVPKGDALAKAVADPNGPFAVPANAEAYFSKVQRAQLKRLGDELERLKTTRVVLAEAMAVAEGKVENVRVHVRGSHLVLAEEVPRQFPRILAGEKHTLIDGKQSGRLQLAQWLTRPEHPLTARVMVNRIWRWHFGEGLVRSADNFGKLGDRPDNQPLLDWLARRFVQNGWSIKAMHRLIMLSSTYQMSTAYNERAAVADPENRLLWRHNRRRLEAEAIRDSLLAIGGQLDRTMGGTLYPGGNRAYVLGYPNSTYDRYDFNRRSIYLPVIRSDLYNVFQAFDFADPSTPNGERATTTVAPQALFMMNSKLMLEQSRNLAGQLLAMSNLDDAGRVKLAFQQVFGRPPSEAETRRSLEFVQRCENTLAVENVGTKERRLRAWQSLGRVLLAGNEFIYVE